MAAHHDKLYPPATVYHIQFGGSKFYDLQVSKPEYFGWLLFSLMVSLLLLAVVLASDLALLLAGHVHSPLAKELPHEPCDPAGEQQGEEPLGKGEEKGEEEVKALDLVSDN